MSAANVLYVPLPFSNINPSLILTFDPQPQKDQSNRYVDFSSFDIQRGPSFFCPVVAADGLSKRDVFRLPDPFAVITVDGEQTVTTSAIKKRRVFLSSDICFPSQFLQSQSVLE